MLCSQINSINSKLFLQADFKTKTRNNLKSLRVYFQSISRTLAPFFNRQTFRT